MGCIMSSIELKARAKINLSLDVIGKREDGYHEVKMIMQTIELHDKVVIESIQSGIEVTCNSQWVPSGEGNIAYKAARLLLSKYNVTDGVRISIDKKIPVAAGLAGGSSNAAAVLKGINRLFSLGLSQEELMLLGKQIGADVPYCIKGGTMLAEGVGERLTQLASFPCTNIVVIKPRIGVSTAWVYGNLDLDKISFRPDTHLLITALNEKRIDVFAKNMKNVLETVTEEKYRIVKEAKDRLHKLGALGCMMSGSGPSVFGIFTDRQAAENAYKAVKNNKWDCFLTQTICEER